MGSEVRAPRRRKVPAQRSATLLPGIGLNPTAGAGWQVTLPSPYSRTAEVRLRGRMVQVDIPTGHDFTGPDADPRRALWGLLRGNTLFSAEWKFILSDASGDLALCLRGELEVGAQEGMAGAVTTLLAGLSEPWHRLHEANRPVEPPAEGPEAGRGGEEQSIADLANLGESLGWDVEPVDDHYALLRSRMRGRPVQVRLSKTANAGSPGVSLSHVPALEHVEQLPAVCQQASALCLLRLGDTLAHVRGSGLHSPEGTLMCFEARRCLPVPSSELDDLMRDLRMAYLQVGKELELLCSESTATRYTSLYGLGQ